MYKVTNNNRGNMAQDFVGRFDGRDFTFPTGKPVYCEDDATRHIFGIGETNKVPVLARHGWAPVSGLLKDGLEILNNFAFEFVEVMFDAPMASDAQPGDDHGPVPVVQNPPSDDSRAGKSDGGVEGDDDGDSPAEATHARGRRR